MHKALICLIATMVIIPETSDAGQKTPSNDATQSGVTVAAGITKSVLIAASDPTSAILCTQTSYTQREGASLIQEFSELVANDTFGRYYIRHSKDNGKIWSPAKTNFTPKITPEGTLRRGESGFLLDQEEGCLIRFYNLHLYPQTTHSRDVNKYTRIFYEISKDGGNTFSPPLQIIIKGFTEKKWAPGVEYGRLSLGISFVSPFIDSKGRIILPVQRPMDSPESMKAYHIPIEAGCLVGTWDDKGTIEWEAGAFACVDLALSSRGLCEPAVAELANGHFLMIARGSNVRLEGVPGRKWALISKDGCKTWSQAEVLGFDDGTLFYSPATGSQLLRSSTNGKLYWVGNILPENPVGNYPRYPLIIGEVNEERLSLIKSSIRGIDTRSESDSEHLQLSNFKMYEDRATGEFVLTMARLHEQTGEALSSPAYQYRIQLP